MSKLFFHEQGNIQNINNAIKYTNVTILDQDDKGNTQIECDCFRCGGTGKIDMYEYVEKGICFKCHGGGRQLSNLKLYTEDRIKTLASAYKKRKEKELEELNKSREIRAIEEAKKYFEMDNELFIIVELNSYNIKEELKVEGFKFNARLKMWYNSIDSKNYKTVKITFDEIYDPNNDFLAIDYNKIIEIVDEYKKLDSSTKFLGSEKDKIQVESIFVNCKSYEGYAYGSYTYYYNFKDSQGNLIQWKTSKDLELIEGQKVSIKGTIKELKYNNEGDKVNALIRCKIEVLEASEDENNIEKTIKDILEGKDIKDRITIGCKLNDGEITLKVWVNHKIIKKTIKAVNEGISELTVRRVIDSVGDKLGF